MVGTQFETRIKAADRGQQAVGKSAFTLTELLVVITIIAILAGLITGAAVNALNRAKQAAITLEMQQLGTAIEEFENKYTAFPPNVYSNPELTSDTERRLNCSTLLKMLKKVSSRSTEFQKGARVGSGNNNVATILQNGLSPAEALVFWLQGFSQDPTRPLSGTDLQVTQVDDNGTTFNRVITIDSFKPLYDFDRGRLRFSRGPDGTRRYLTIYRAGGTDPPVQLQLYEYLPANSEQPYVYFDTSRETPQQVVDNWDTTEFFYTNPKTGGTIYPFKQVRPNAPQDRSEWSTPKLQYIDYVEKGKYQILHCGIDDIWGNFSNDTAAGGVGGTLNMNDRDEIPRLLAPEGPFIGDIADNLGHFMGGTLEDKQE